MLHSVTTVTPLRISLAGGGSDIPSFYRAGYGSVVSMAIRSYVYVTAKRHSPLFGEKYRVSYSTTETADDVEAIDNDIVRTCIQFLGIDEPLHIITSSDLPAQSGLGSSSSFCVGLLKALHEIRGDSISPGQLAEEACHIEMELLGMPIGKQDQYAASFGGLNYIKFDADESVSLESLPLHPHTLAFIDELFLVWTGVSRSAATVLADQERNAERNGAAIAELVQSAELMRNRIRAGTETASSLGLMLSSNWEVKKNLGALIETPQVIELISKLHSLGSRGHKIAGAGGGGFVLGVASDEAVKRIRKTLGIERLVRPKYCPWGSWTLGLVE